MRKTSVNQYTTTGERVASYESLSEASRQTGVNVHDIWMSANFIRYTAGKYVWRYAGTEKEDKESKEK
jgi:hypothetical protein